MFLGIDGGTEAVRAAVFDARGQRLATGVRRYATQFPEPGWAEQDPVDWWNAIVGAVRDCLAAPGISAEAVQGIGVDATTCTLLAVNANGEPLRPALLWMDVRASDQARHIGQTGHPALQYSLAGVSAEWMPAKALWLKENEPETYHASAYFLEYVDWIIYRLTGRFTLNLNTITQRWYYSRPDGGWPGDFYAQIGIGDVLDKFPQTILPLGHTAGGLHPDAAEALGLRPGIPVAAGGGDAFVGLLGLGVVQPGSLGVVMGSSNVVSGLSPTPIHFPGAFGSFPDAVIPGLHLLEGGQVSTGSILNWFKRNFAVGLADAPFLYEMLDAEAANVPIGSDGLIVLDYFQGNRTPHTDAQARGCIVGLSLQSSRAHVYRALMEGIAYGLREILDTFRTHDYHAQQIITCGGATRSPLFMQIYTDVLGLPLVTTQEPEASMLGAAVLAAVAAGAYPDLSTASLAMTQRQRVYQPCAEAHAAYTFYFDMYRRVYHQLRDTMHDLTRHSPSESINL
jgi:FGGY-family pentulose kinase